MPWGPQPMTHEQRLELAQRIADRLQDHYGEETLALGVYGSLARGTDGPYSDIEMHCVLHGRGIERCFEWSSGPWKAEVDVYSADVILAQAAEVDVDWPITHGAFVKVLPLYDPVGFFPRLRATALGGDMHTFRRVIKDNIVGEIYELIGKIRNLGASGDTTSLAYYAVHLAKHGACLLGLVQRHLYTSSARLLPESLILPARPQGYDTLCRMVMAGDLGDAQRLMDTADAFWAGVEAWTEQRGLHIEEDLDALLALEKGKA